MMRRLLLTVLAAILFVPPLFAEPPAPPASMPRPEAVYTPAPVYRPEWAKQGLAGKGMVLVTVDKDSGKVTGAKMLDSTGSQLLDGAALQAYSQWRFKPGTAIQVKLPIEFRPGPPPTAARQKPAYTKPALLYPLLILIGFAAAVLLMRMNRRA
jgi:TonB family protein